MNKIETRGVIKEIKGIEKFDSGFYKRSIIIDQNDNIKSEYPKLLQIDFLKDKSDLVNDLLLDGIYEFKLNLNSNKAGERYFTNVSCWGVTQLNPEAPKEETDAPSKGFVPVGGMDRKTPLKGIKMTSPEQSDLPF